MPPKIFIDDFEKTENSDYLHGVLGRSLIIATRFDSMCTTLSQAMDIKLGAFFFTLIMKNLRFFIKKLYLNIVLLTLVSRPSYSLKK